MVKLADTQVLEACPERGVGSSPTGGTTRLFITAGSMEQNVLADMGFFLGVATYLFFVSQQKQQMLSGLMVILIVSFLGSIMLSIVLSIGWGFSILLVTVLMALGFSGYYWKEMIPVITEVHVCSYTILFWFLYVQFLQNTMPADLKIWVIISGILFSFVSLLAAYTDMDDEQGWRLLLAFWYLVVNALVLYVSLQQGGTILLTTSPLNMYVWGVVCMIVGRNIFYVMIAHPLLRQLFSVHDDGERVPLFEDADTVIVNRFDPLNLPWWSITALIVLETGIVGSNLFFHLVDDMLLMNAVVIFVPLGVQILTLWVDVQLSQQEQPEE